MCVLGPISAVTGRTTAKYKVLPNGVMVVFEDFLHPLQQRAQIGSPSQFSWCKDTLNGKFQTTNIS